MKKKEVEGAVVSLRTAAQSLFFSSTFEAFSCTEDGLGFLFLTHQAETSSFSID